MIIIQYRVASTKNPFVKQIKPLRDSYTLRASYELITLINSSSVYRVSSAVNLKNTVFLEIFGSHSTMRPKLTSALLISHSN